MFGRDPGAAFAQFCSLLPMMLCRNSLVLHHDRGFRFWRLCWLVALLNEPLGKANMQLAII